MWTQNERAPFAILFFLFSQNLCPEICFSERFRLPPSLARSRNPEKPLSIWPPLAVPLYIETHMTSHRRALPPVVESAMLEDEGLRAPDDLAEALMDIKLYIGGDTVSDGIVMPRFGVLSLKARQTPMYVYDHPALKEISATSFSDSQHIFINADFMRKLMAEEDASNGEKEGVLPLLLRNLTGMLLRHHTRFERFPSLIADIGADMSINAKLRLAYPDMQWVPSLLDVSPGASLPPKDLKRVAKLAEETIIRELLSAHNHLLDKKTPPQDPDEDELLDPSKDQKEAPKDSDGKEKSEQEKKDEKAKKEAQAKKDKDAKEKKDKKEKKDPQDPPDEQDGEQDPDGDEEMDGSGEQEPGEGDEPSDEPGQPGGEGGQPGEDGQGGEPSDMDGEGEPSDQDMDGSPQESREQSAPRNDKPPKGQQKSRAARKVDPQTIKELLEEMKAGGEKATEGNNATHSIPLQQMAEVLENNNLESTKDRLEIPDSDDQETIDKKQETTELNDIHDIAKSVQMAGGRGGNGMGHIEGAAHEMVKGITDGKVSWKLGLQEMILGEGMKFAYSEEVPGDLFYVDPTDMGMNLELFIGQELPMKNQQAVMVLLDTSGSITQELFDMFLSEILALAKSQNPDSDQASEVIMLMCDDVLRGQPILIDENNVDSIREKGMQVQGRGGNDIGGTIRAASKLDMFREKNVRAIVYFTDLGDRPPRRTDCPPNVSLTFLCPPGDKDEEFIRAVKDFARVYPIDEGIDVALDADEAMAAEQINWKVKEGRRNSFAF